MSNKRRIFAACSRRARFIRVFDAENEFRYEDLDDRDDDTEESF